MTESKFKQQEYCLMNEFVDTTCHFVLEKLQSISSDSAFEKVTKYYLERLGATNVMIPAKPLLSKEQGDADVIAVFEALQIKVIVQVKHYLKAVDAEAVKQILASKSFYEEKSFQTLRWNFMNGGGKVCGTISSLMVNGRNTRYGSSLPMPKGKVRKCS